MKERHRQQQQNKKIYVHEKADEHENIKTCCVLCAFIHECIKMFTLKSIEKRDS